MSDETKSVFGRRRTLTWLAGALLAPEAVAQATGFLRPISHHPSPITPFAPVVPGYAIHFPRDAGSHPEFRIEWWYVTGWLDETSDQPLGFQITFFRARPDLQQNNPSTFTPRQVIIAHAALSDPRRGRLIHTQRAARAVFELAGAALGDTRVWIDGWRLNRQADGYRAEISAQEFSLDLVLHATQPPLLQGENGFSRKGPALESASYYYSVPHLKVNGTLTRGGSPRRVNGVAWLDHEWSSQYLQREAAGWDWIGINLHDGGALMAFRMRDRQGGQFWAGGALRHPNGRLEELLPDQVRFIPRREWKSPRTGTSYPVSFLVKAGNREFAIKPLFDDQENDTRASTGTIYWEGAVRAYRGKTEAGLGYLELTGYWRPMGF